MRKRIKMGAGLGPLLVAGGIGAMVTDFDLSTAGRIAVIVGVIIVYTDRIQRTNVASKEQYDLGYDLGYERGWKDREEESHPTLVDLNARREDGPDPSGKTCGDDVVDRG